MTDQDGPSLREYVEVRFNGLLELIQEGRRADTAISLQRFEASEKAILKAESATELRFQGVNEFRRTLDDQQKTFIPRAEVMVMEGAALNRLGALEKQIEHLMAERAGVRGGYGYAVGIIGVVSLILTWALRLMGSR